MTQRAKKMAQRLQAFTDEVVDFVQGCSDTDWRKVCKEEDWTVGVTARHIGAGHFQTVGLAKWMGQACFYAFIVSISLRLWAAAIDSPR
jgi:hypothetical protein